jgi:RNA polymerase sigma-70 factor (ECF subfamily)
MTTLDAAPRLTADAFDAHRPALLGYCYRMLGSAADADDAVQETMVRAWRNLDGFEGRAPLEAWLYRIATNVCLNLLRGRRRRALPMDVAEASPATAPLGAPPPGEVWVEPMPDRLITSPGADPGEVAATRDSVRLAFVAALQLLPPRQRAVLILRDVLRWRAEEVATLLDASVVSVKSALQRARATLAAHPPAPAAPVDRELLDRYLDAFRRYDVDELVGLLRDDATLSMPPYPLWLRGPEAIRAWLVRMADECAHLVGTTIAANGTLGFTQYQPGGPGGALAPFAVTLLEGTGGLVTAVHAFLDPVAVTRFESTGRAGPAVAAAGPTGTTGPGR